MKKRIRVFHLIKSLGRGGAETLLPETLKFHHSNNFIFQYAYFLPRKNQVVPAIEQIGGRVKCFTAANNVAIIFKIRDLVKYIRNEKIDLIHAHLPWAGFVAGIAGKLVGVPVIYTEHNNITRYHWLTRWLSTYSYKNYQKVLMVSSEAFLAAKNYFKHHFPCSVETLLNGIDSDKFIRNDLLRAEVRSTFKWSNHEIVIGLVAVYREQKRIDRWLQIAQNIHLLQPNTRFLLVGTGPLQNHVDDWISFYGLQDVIMQTGLQEDVLPYYNAMDIFLMSSDFEGLPIALLESMSMGVVPVVSDVGGMPEVVDDSCGYVYQKENIAQAADAIARLIRDPHILNQKRTAARQKMVDKFDIRLMVAQLEKIYADL
jgi:glycosyltransferase involved in cell wall biosynthesis